MNMFLMKAIHAAAETRGVDILSISLSLSASAPALRRTCRTPPPFFFSISFFFQPRKSG